jgi:hypothetical protein
MTLISLSSATTSADAHCMTSQGPLNSSFTAESSPIPRLTLRKRTVSGDANAELRLPTVTSDFLSGLFADVAQVQMEAVEPSEPVEIEDRPSKKSRLSLNLSLSRSCRSFKNLSKLHETAASPTGVADYRVDLRKEGPLIPSLSKPSLSKHDSLHFQLCCVGSDVDDLSSDPTQTVLKAGELAFPHLPATVSNTSCSALTRNLSDLQTSLTETQDKEAYGWFVVVDDDTKQETVVDPYASTTNLAFVAPTAPLATNHDDEVEWAKAADMVDDVLGDFF